MGGAEKRKSVRRIINYRAFLDFGDGAPMRECSLCDASQDGAQLLVADPTTVPDVFTLALSADGAARRNCRVAWRTKTSIGVEFLRPPKKTGRPGVPSYMQQFLPKTDAVETAAPAAKDEPNAAAPAAKDEAQPQS